MTSTIGSIQTKLSDALEKYLNNTCNGNVECKKVIYDDIKNLIFIIKENLTEDLTEERQKILEFLQQKKNSIKDKLNENDEYIKKIKKSLEKLINDLTKKSVEGDTTEHPVTTDPNDIDEEPMGFNNETKNEMKNQEIIEQYFKSKDSFAFNDQFGITNCEVAQIISEEFDDIIAEQHRTRLIKCINFIIYNILILETEIDDILKFFFNFRKYIPDQLVKDHCQEGKDDTGAPIINEDDMSALLDKIEEKNNFGSGVMVKIEENIEVKLNQKIIKLQKRECNFKCICAIKIQYTHPLTTKETYIEKDTTFTIEGKGEGVEKVQIIHNNNSASEISVNDLKKIILASSLIIEEVVKGFERLGGGSRRKTRKRKFNKKKSKRNRKTKTKNRNKKTKNRNRKNKNRKYSKKRN